MRFWRGSRSSGTGDGSERGRSRTVLLTGFPRSGTTLSCHLLNRLPGVVALHEPLSPGRFFGLSPAKAVRRVAEKLDEARTSLLEHGTAPSWTVGGAVPDNHMAAGSGADGLRPSLAERGELQVDKPLGDDFLLVVKHPALFTALLEPLGERFDVFAIVRNPLSVLASWSTVDLPVQRGRVPTAEGLDPELARSLDAEDDVLGRRLRILAWFAGRLVRGLPPERIVRYEDIVATRGRALGVIAPGAASLDEPLESRNLSALYPHDELARFAERLLALDGPIWELYDRTAVTALLA